MSDRQKVFFALVASAVLHCTGVLFLAVWTRLHPVASATTESDQTPLEVTLVAAPTPEAVLAGMAPTPAPKKVIRSELDSDGLAVAETPPENAMFESDQNSRAASELPATGDAPLPTQEGKERPFAEFESHDYSLGKGMQPAPVMEVAKATAPAAPPPEPSPAAVTQVEPPKNPEKPKSIPEPTPEQTPAPTPEPTATPQPDAVMLGTPTPTPSPTPAESPSPLPTQLAKLVTTPALRSHAEPPREQQLVPADPGYRPQREKTKVDGGISNRGKAGVDAVSSPLGRYKKAVADAVGSRWYHYVNQQMDLITVGEVHIKFRVTTTGRVEGVKIVSNTANESFGGFCIRSVSEAKIPPIPPEVAPVLEDGQLEIDYRFNIYPQ